jgi:hypothetical protein
VPIKQRLSVQTPVSPKEEEKEEEEKTLRPRLKDTESILMV